MHCEAAGFVDLTFRSALIPGKVYEVAGHENCGGGEGTILWLRTKEEVRAVQTPAAHFIPAGTNVPEASFVKVSEVEAGHLLLESADGFEAETGGFPIGPLEEARHKGSVGHRIPVDAQ